MIYPKREEIAEGLKMGAKAPVKTRKKKRKKQVQWLYWSVVVFLASWMLYLNINVLFDYHEIREEYQQTLQVYEEKKRILEDRILEFQRLRDLVDHANTP